jgi:hypothetical protein
LLWEHKALNARGWREVERDGLKKTYPQYLAQVSLYQGYLDVTNPPELRALGVEGDEEVQPIAGVGVRHSEEGAVNIVEATRAGELLPRAYDDPADWRCKMCPHKERCWR